MVLSSLIYIALVIIVIIIIVVLLRFLFGVLFIGPVVFENSIHTHLSSISSQADLPHPTVMTYVL